MSQRSIARAYPGAPGQAALSALCDPPQSAGASYTPPVRKPWHRRTCLRKLRDANASREDKAKALVDLVQSYEDAGARFQFGFGCVIAGDAPRVVTTIIRGDMPDEAWALANAALPALLSPVSATGSEQRSAPVP